MTTKKTAATKAGTPAKKSPAEKHTVPAKPVAKSNNKTGVKAALQLAAKKPKKEHKLKVVRDSFTMPQSDYEKIGEFKELCLKSGMHVKKSELLRAGLHALGKLSIAQLKTALSELEKIETGRPKKS